MKMFACKLEKSYLQCENTIKAAKTWCVLAAFIVI